MAAMRTLVDMKKLLNKLKRKKQSAIQGNNTGSQLRITNETVAEHRERILAGGRKFKYPLQYPKHRIVAITIVLVLLLGISLMGIITWQLYGAQNTGKFIHRITEVIPVPVAEVEGQMVRYNNYLLELRSALHYLSTKEAVNFSSDDGKRQLDYQKRLALNKAIESAYIQKLAKEQSVQITKQELEEFIEREIKNNSLGVTEDVYRQVIKDYYDWSFDDYRESVKKQLLRKKIVAKVDIDGRQKIQSLLNSVQQGSDFSELAKQHSEDQLSKASGGDIGFVDKNADDPNELIKVAEALQPNQVSDVIEGVDGFYLIKLMEKRESNIHFIKLFVSYKTITQKLEELRKNNKIKEYINVPETVSSTNRQ